MIGRLICWWKGAHLRGVRVQPTQTNEYGYIVPGKIPVRAEWMCPRCGAHWYVGKKPKPRRFT
ncbi:MAG: hypothetical protein NUV74_05170 [Candidatus Brocadiaceae bacterium]|nr:hypothetical protein [Candidatus Brocadiaceae bacterium]